MRALIGFIVRGRFQAIVIATICAALAPVFAPLNYVSGAVIGLMTLRYGAYEGFVVLAATTALFGTLAVLMLNSAMPTILILALTWAPTWVLATTLRLTSSQGAALAVAGALAVLAVIVFHGFVDNATDWWSGLLDRLLARGIEELNLSPDPQALAQLDRILDGLAPVMTGLLAAGIIFGAVLTLLLARWWHSLVDNPGGFGKEFRALRLDRRLGFIVLGLALVAWLGSGAVGGLGRELLSVALVLYFFQGLAMIHGVVAQTSASRGWLFALYLGAAFATAQIVLLVAIGGLADSWLDIRGRLSARGQTQ